MTYFIIRALLSFVIAFLLLQLLLKLLSRYQKERCRKARHVFYPSFCVLALFLYVLRSTAPLAFDGLSVARKIYAFKQVTVSSRQALPGYLKTEDGDVFKYAPFTLEIEPGKTYNLSYTPLQKYIIEINEIDLTK